MVIPVIFGRKPVNEYRWMQAEAIKNVVQLAEVFVSEVG